MGAEKLNFEVTLPTPKVSNWKSKIVVYIILESDYTKAGRHRKVG
jgi:hypothetical protein